MYKRGRKIIKEHPAIQHSDVSDAEAKDIAKQAYINMPVVRMVDVARRAGRPVPEVTQWRDEGNWLHERAGELLRKQSKLAEAVGAPVADHGAIVSAARQLLELFTQRMQKLKDQRLPVTAGDLRRYVDSISKIQQVISSSYRAVGLQSRE